MKQIILIAISLLIFQCGGNPIIKKKESQRPNLVFIIADQWRAQATGFAGNPDVITPNLDSLAGESIVFTNAVSGLPSCAPFRASLLTGQYWLTHGVFYNDKPLDSDAISMAKVFKDAGYQTGFIGKWHLNGDPVIDPAITRTEPVPEKMRQGFDYWQAREVTHQYNNSYYFDENNIKRFWKGYDAFAQTDEAINFIEEKSQGKQPFILFLSWGPPHDPYQSAPEKFKDLYKDPTKLNLRPNVPDSLSMQARQTLSGYYAHIAALDTKIGDLKQALKENGIDENTILVFTSDHGDMLYSHGEKKKQQPWDESIKIPFLVRYPGKLGNNGREIRMPFNAPDIMPTLLSLSGLSIPATVEGMDFSPYIMGELEEIDNAALLTSVMPFHNWSPVKGGREYRGLRTKQYTYVRDLNGPWLLYDNKEDPFQLYNLVNKEKYSNIQEDLDKRLNFILKNNGDEFLPGEYYMKKWNYGFDPQDF